MFRRIPGLALGGLCTLAAALLLPLAAPLAADDVPARITDKAAKVTLSKRDIVCAAPGGASAPVIGALLEAPGREYLDAAAMALRAIVQGPSQSYVITAATEALGGGLLKGGPDVLLAGLAADFSPRWATVLGGPASDLPSSVTPTADGGYAVVAETRSLWFSTVWRWTSTGPPAALLSKYDRDGTLQWAQYHTPGGDVGLSSVVAPDSGGIVFGGSAWRERWAGFLVRLSDRGEHQWAREIGRDYEDTVAWIAKAPGGGLLLSGSRRITKPSRHEVWVARVSDAGELVWAHSYRSDEGGSTGFATPTADGGALIVRAAQRQAAAPRSRVPVIAIDAKGNVTWAELFEFEESVKLSAVFETSSGHYLLFGGAALGEQAAGPLTLELDRDGRIVASRAMSVTQAAATGDTAFMTGHDAVAVVADHGVGFVVMGEGASVPTDLVLALKAARARADLSDAMRARIKRQLYFLRVGEAGAAGPCSRPVAVVQRKMAVQDETIELPLRDIPPERSTFIPGTHLRPERFVPR